MTGPEHYREAERHLREAFACTEDQNYLSDWNQRQALVHATLALAAATYDYDWDHAKEATR